ncbi:MAG: BON domain-containing protein [Armatimonadota bacterium]|nr:BON domain-containing protein [Armatimonadota bacterium]
MKSTAQPAKAAATPTPMSKSVALGIAVLKALNSQAAMNGSQISVGTSTDTVWLNGTVKNQAQSQLAVKTARQKAPGYKIVNKLQAGGKSPAGNRPGNQPVANKAPGKAPVTSKSR